MIAKCVCVEGQEGLLVFNLETQRQNQLFLFKKYLIAANQVQQTLNTY